MSPFWQTRFPARQWKLGIIYDHPHRWCFSSLSRHANLLWRTYTVWGHERNEPYTVQQFNRGSVFACPTNVHPLGKGKSASELHNLPKRNRVWNCVYVEIVQHGYQLATIQTNPNPSTCRIVLWIGLCGLQIRWMPITLPGCQVRESAVASGSLGRTEVFESESTVTYTQSRVCVCLQENLVRN